jgi:hypothetical protein
MSSSKIIKALEDVADEGLLLQLSVEKRRFKKLKIEV